MTGGLQFDNDDVLQREVHSLVLACLESTATTAERLRLKQLVCEDSAAQHLYIHYIHDSLMLRRWAITGSGRIGREFTTTHSSDGIRGDEHEEEQTQLDTLVNPLLLDSSPLAPRAPYPAPGFLSTTLHGTVGYFSSGWPVAYLVATVIFGIGLVIGAVVHVSRYEEVANNSPPMAAEQRLDVQPKAEVVGRITGMVNCKWETKGLGIGD